MQLITSQLLTNDRCRSTLESTTTGGTNWPVWDRFISLDGRQLFHIGNICGTCEFFFSRLVDREVPSFELDQIRSTLEEGIRNISEMASAFSGVIPNGEYTVALFTAFPRQSGVNGVPDYFASEQRLAWRNSDTDDRQIA